jgi:hypothetical protein
MNSRKKNYTTLPPENVSPTLDDSFFENLTVSSGQTKKSPDDSLFPKNYLDTEKLKDKERLSKLLNEFKDLLDTNLINERGIVKFIKDKQADFLVGSLLKKYHFGHHDAYLFPEFKLADDLVVDYLLAGLGSGGWEFVFIEFEAPKKKITLKDGHFGDSYRKGIKQINDWENWLHANYSTLKLTYKKKMKDGVTLPKEFTELDISRLHFVVVAGRRGDYKDTTYNLRRQTSKRDNILYLHYDNIVDAAQNIIGQWTY